MGLPQLNVDLRYDITLPISGKTLEVRPYLVKEEKILLTALESDSKADIAAATKTVLSNCTFGYDIDSLPLIDVEYLMLKLKMYSAGEIVTIHVKCNNKVDKPIINPETLEPTGETVNEACGEITDIDVDLEHELEIDVASMNDPKIHLTDTVGMVLRPPVFELFEQALNSGSGTEVTFDVLANCIDIVWDGEEVIKEFTADEAEEFLGNLRKKQLKKVKDYLKSIPEIAIKKDFKCPKCGYEQEIILKNFFDFFTD